MNRKSSRMCSTKKPFSPALLLVVAATLLLALAFLPQPALAATAITTCAELQNIRDNFGDDYYSANDIDCSGFDCGDDGEGFMPIGWSSKITGKFDGKGYKITHLLFIYKRTSYK